MLYLLIALVTSKIIHFKLKFDFDKVAIFDYQ